MLYTIVYAVSMPLFKIFYRIKYVGIVEYGERAGYVFAVNHTSNLDPVLAAVCLYPHRVRFMAKAELWNIPILGRLIKALGAFPVSRGGYDRKAIVEALSILKSGGSLMMFPEGGRVRGSASRSFKEGMAVLAKKTGAWIVPVGISGADLAFPDGTRFPRFPKIVVTFGTPIAPDRFPEDPSELTAQVMDEIKRLAGGSEEAAVDEVRV